MCIIDLTQFISEMYYGKILNIFLEKYNFHYFNLKYCNSTNLTPEGRSPNGLIHLL